SRLMSPTNSVHRRRSASEPPDGGEWIRLSSPAMVGTRSTGATVPKNPPDGTETVLRLTRVSPPASEGTSFTGITGYQGPTRWRGDGPSPCPCRDRACTGSPSLREDVREVSSRAGEPTGQSGVMFRWAIAFSVEDEVLG